MRRKSAACVFSLLCALLLTMWAPAYAAQPLVPALDEIPAVLYGEDSALSGQICLLDADEPVWGEDDTSYKDQLTGYALDIYKALGNAFSDFDGSLETGVIVREDREIGGVNYTGWLVTGVFAADVEVDLTGVTDNAVASALVNAAYSEWVLERYAHVAVACAAFTKDHPEYFWISASYYPTNEYESIEWADDSYSTYVIKGLKMNIGFTVQPECDTVDEIADLRTRLDLVINALLVETRELSIPAKLTYWDNWLAENNDYNQEAAANSSVYSDHTPWTIVGGFLPEYQPVCEGYAKAFQLLCLRDGIPCVQVDGLGITSTEGGNHMWTAVKLDGSWYLCDPTWNDPIYAYEGGTSATRDYSTKEYLMKADQASHIASTTYVVPPEISDSDYLVEEYGLTEDGRISGYEIGIGRMMIVLYDQDKMIGFGFCEAVQYGSDADGEEQVYIHYPPDFDRALLGQADRVVRIHVGETSWVPVSQLNVITRM